MTDWMRVMRLNLWCRYQSTNSFFKIKLELSPMKQNLYQSQSIGKSKLQILWLTRNERIIISCETFALSACKYSYLPSENVSFWNSSKCLLTVLFRSTHLNEKFQRFCSVPKLYTHDSSLKLSYDYDWVLSFFLLGTYLIFKVSSKYSNSIITVLQ